MAVGEALQGKIALGACAILAALVVANTFTIVGNIDVRPRSLPITSSRNLVSAAQEHNHDKIIGGASLYYLLDREIAGASLTLPRALKRHRGSFRRVSSLDVTVKSLPPLSKEAVRKLESQVDHKASVYRSKRKLNTIQFVFDKSARRYVIVPTDHRDVDWMLLPEADYTALAGN